MKTGILKESSLTLEAYQEFLLPRKPDAQKGDFGHVLVVGGGR